MDQTGFTPKVRLQPVSLHTRIFYFRLNYWCNFSGHRPRGQGAGARDRLQVLDHRHQLRLRHQHAEERFGRRLITAAESILPVLLINDNNLQPFPPWQPTQRPTPATTRKPRPMTTRRPPPTLPPVRAPAPAAYRRPQESNHFSSTRHQSILNSK